MTDDIAAFDLQATSRYIGIAQFGAASPALSWLVGGTMSGACRGDWCTRDAGSRWRSLLRGLALAVPCAIALKYGVLAQLDLPTLGRSVQATQLEEQLAGLNGLNMANDALVMGATLFLWRKLLLYNPDLMR